MDIKAIDHLVKKHGIISDQIDAAELRVILQELVRTVESGVEGAVVEFGCYRGTTSLYVRRIMDAAKQDRPFHVYDSFAGLPEKTRQDSSPAGLQFVVGELSVSKNDFIKEFKKAGLRLPVIHKGWFNELTADDVPAPIALAFLDGDYYESVRDSLRLIENKLAPGAAVIVDDYANEALPGAARAVDEWAATHGTPRVQTIASLAVIHL